MKIEHGFQDKQIKILSSKNLNNIEKNKDFSDFLQEEHQHQTKEQLNQLLVKIDDQGKKLLISRNLRELSAYKALIKQFMDEVIGSTLLLEDKFSYDNIGRKKKYKIIKEIDEKLVSLANMILEKESDKLSILQQMGDIKGLIINLYY
ncbi:MAG: YaaR family protein [Vulcanibacillus sp.]